MSEHLPLLNMELNSPRGPFSENASSRKVVIKENKANNDQIEKSNALLDFAKRNDFTNFKKVLNDDVDLSFGYVKHGNLPILGCLALNKKIDDLHLYINAVLDTEKVDINEYFTFKWKLCAVHLATQKGNLPALKALVDHGADLGAQNKYGRTALHNVVAQWQDGVESYQECLKFLLDKVSKEQLNILELEGRSAIHMAAYKNNWTAADLILKKGKVLPLQLDDRYYLDRNNRKVSARDALLDTFPQLPVQGSLPPPIPVQMDTSRLFQLLCLKEEDRFCEEFLTLETKITGLANANNGETSLLYEACRYNLSKAVKLLLDSGAEPNSNLRKRHPPAFLCARMGHFESMKHLLPKTDEPTRETVLAEVCNNRAKLAGGSKIIKMILEDYEVDNNSVNKVLKYLELQNREIDEMLDDWIKFIYAKFKSANDDVNEQFSNGKCAIHFAAAYGFPKALQKLIDKGADLGALDSEGRTALHTVVLADWNDDDSHKEVLKILHAKINQKQLNILDRKGYSAVHLAAKKVNWSAAELIIYNERRLQIEGRGQWVHDNETALNALYDAFPQHLKQNLRYMIPKRMDGSRLFQLLYAKKQGRFCENFMREESEMAKLLEETNGTLTFLQVACVSKLLMAANFLLDCYEKYELAVETVKTLVTKYAEDGLYEPVNILLPKCDQATKILVLHKVCRFNDNDHREILKKLLEDDELDVNANDDLGNTALYYAQEVGGHNSKIVTMLKDSVVKSVLKDVNANNELRNAPCELLRGYLDSKITKTGGSSEENFYIKFDLELKEAPARKGPWRFPLPLLAMSNHPDQRLLLDHPLVTAYTFIRWQHLKILYYINLLFYLAFCILLTAYILYGYQDNSEGETIISNVAMRSVILVLTAIFFVRELTQMIVRPSDYLWSLDNLLELPLVFLTTVLVVMDCGGSDINTPGGLCPQLNAVAMLVSWIVLMMLIGKHPYSCVEVEMLRNVSFNFFKSLRTYFILILAFGLSFFVLFRGCSGDCTGRNPFNDPGSSLFKTIIMVTGEFDSSDIDFEKYIATTHIIFIVFVFLISIVLLNLLNGLAVADTSSMQKDAYLVTCIARINLITFFDEISENHIVFRLFKLFYNINPAPTPWMKVNSSNRSVELSQTQQSSFLMDEETVNNARKILKKDVRGTKAIKAESVKKLKKIAKTEAVYHMDATALREVRQVLVDGSSTTPIGQMIAFVDNLLKNETVSVQVCNVKEEASV